MRKIFKNFELSGLSASLFGVGVSVNFKKKTYSEKEGDKSRVESLTQILSELYTFRKAMTDFSLRYEALKDMLDVGEDEERVKEEIAEKLFLRTFDVYSDVSKLIFSSRYFALLDKEEKMKIINSFDYVVYEEVRMEEDESYFLDISEQIELVEELRALFEEVTIQIERVSDELDLSKQGS
ncbi:hypothetical protein ACM7Q1_12740 [Paenibacillus illinoisensis]|uniref:hypothetical protein n=1 Tax=Paenibacillus illinoisensis TaxID=59845 RepID=UPI003A4DCEEB